MMIAKCSIFQKGEEDAGDEFRREDVGAVSGDAPDIFDIFDPRNKTIQQRSSSTL